MSQKNSLTWFITGCSSGFGRELTKVVLARGYRAVVTARNTKQVEDLVAGHEDRTLALRLDVTDPAQVAESVRRAEERFAGIDVLVNNAGIGYFAAVEESDEADVRRMFEIDFFGLARMTRAVLPGMKSFGSGAIVNISSIWGMVGHHFGSTYCAAKAAILGFTKSWAKELAPHKITVNAIAPGGVTSPMAIEKDGIDAVRERMKKIPLQRWAEPEEIADTVVFLASPLARAVTGQCLDVNCGEYHH